MFMSDIYCTCKCYLTLCVTQRTTPKKKSYESAFFLPKYFMIHEHCVRGDADIEIFVFSPNSTWKDVKIILFKFLQRSLNSLFTFRLIWCRVSYRKTGCSTSSDLLNLFWPDRSMQDTVKVSWCYWSINKVLKSAWLSIDQGLYSSNVAT